MTSFLRYNIQLKRAFSVSDLLMSSSCNPKPILEMLSSISEAPALQVRSIGQLMIAEQQSFIPTSVLQQFPSIRSSSNPGSYPCTQCGKMYMWRTNLQRHLRLECGKEPQCKCPYCPHKTNRKDVLLTHVKLIHKTSNLCPTENVYPPTS
jgi:DNA-directed RNA polymerase subunit RPC12/RpoP